MERSKCRECEFYGDQLFSPAVRALEKFPGEIPGHADLVEPADQGTRDLLPDLSASARTIRDLYPVLSIIN